VQIDAALLQVLVLLLPGLTARMVFGRLRANRAFSVWETIIEVFLFTFASYAIAGAIVSAATGTATSGSNSTNLEAILSQTGEIDWPELYMAVVISVLLAALVAAAYNYKIVTVIGRVLRITRRFGDEDVWEYLHNSPDVEWVYVRDHLQDVTYYGRISSFSDRYKQRELVLSDAIAFENDTGARLYEVDGVYVSRDVNTVTLEIPLYSSHVPESLTRDDFAQLEAHARPGEAEDLHRIYRVNEETDEYSLHEKASARTRRRVQGLLNRAGLSVIHLRERDSANGEPE
jgi:hypothetical protein